MLSLILAAGASRKFSGLSAKKETLIARKCIRCLTWELAWWRSWPNATPNARCRSCTQNESAGSNAAAERHGFFTCHPERSRGIPQCYLEVLPRDASVRAGLALSLGMAIGGARQAKKDKSGIHEGNREPHTFP